MDNTECERRRAFVEIAEQLLRIVTKFGILHGRPYDFGTGTKLYPAEVHTLQCIGDHPGINVTELARHQGVTKGATSQMLAKLAAKGLLYKKSSQGSDKEVVAVLTDEGERAREGHVRFHAAMTDQILEKTRNIDIADIRLYRDINSLVEKHLDELLATIEH
ncbi:MAG: MarR family transcriptional regulator [Chitinivibrionales bacterium]|nr:MarR family transcriptional regulator [Chitinivibrionales bacterium]